MLFCFRYALLMVSFLVVGVGFQNCTRVNPSEVDSLGLMNAELGGLDGVLGNGSLPGEVEPGAGGALPNIDGAAGGSAGDAAGGPVGGSAGGTTTGTEVIPDMPEQNTPAPSPTPVVDSFDTCAECTAQFFNQKTEAEEGCYQSIRNLSFPLEISDDAQNFTRQLGLSVNLKEARTVVIRKIIGRVQVDRARSLDVAGAGSLFARADEVIGAISIRGGVCLGAGRVGKIADAKGQVNVAAQEVGEISNISNNVRIYGGVVHTLQNIQGHVCLHGNAKVLNYSNIAGGIKNCD